MAVFILDADCWMKTHVPMSYKVPVIRHVQTSWNSIMFSFNSNHFLLSLHMCTFYFCSSYFPLCLLPLLLVRLWSNCNFNQITVIRITKILCIDFPVLCSKIEGLTWITYDLTWTNLRASPLSYCDPCLVAGWEKRETGSATKGRNTINNESQDISSKQAVRTGWMPQALVICTEFPTASFSESVQPKQWFCQSRPKNKSLGWAYLGFFRSDMVTWLSALTELYVTARLY